jgi:hypothetical protein
VPVTTLRYRKKRLHIWRQFFKLLKLYYVRETGWRTWRLRNHGLIPCKAKGEFFFSKKSRPALGPLSLLLNGYRGNTDVASALPFNLDAFIEFNTVNSVHCRDTNCYIKTNYMHSTLLLWLFHFTPTCFDVRNAIFRECTKSFLHLVAGSMCILLLGLWGCSWLPATALHTL